MRARVTRKGKLIWGKHPYLFEYNLRKNQRWELKIEGESYQLRKDNVRLGIPQRVFSKYFEIEGDGNE